MNGLAMLGWLFFGILGFIVLGYYPFRYSGDMNQMSTSRPDFIGTTAFDANRGWIVNRNSRSIASGEKKQRDEGLDNLDRLTGRK